MSELNPLSGETLDLTKENIEKLKELFPEVLTENQIDFEKLRLILGDEINDKPEKYSFTWNGKNDAIKLAQQPSTGTLRPNKEKSKNWDRTENLYIEGDNLEVLKSLQKSYAGKVKVIYIDPPYNTGNDFIYNDNFVDNIENYLEQTGQVSDKGSKYSTNSESSGRFHTDWLNMIYPRLVLSKNILSDEGVIFISIDNNEYANLKKLCDEVFGEYNYVTTINIEMSLTQGMKVASAQKGNIVKNGEYILVYSKNGKKNIANNILYDHVVGFDTHYSYYLIENEDKRTYKSNSLLEYIKSNDKLLSLFNKYEIPISLRNFSKMMNVSEDFKKWMFDNSDNIYQETMASITVPKDIYTLLESGEIVKYNKYILKMVPSSKNIRQFIPYSSSLGWSDDYNPIYGRRRIRGDYWKGYYSDMMNIQKEGDVNFKNGKKPVRLIKQIIKMCIGNEPGIVMDFFSGSGTTGQAVMEYGVDNPNVKFIMVQLPEVIEKGEYDNITSLAQERLSNVISKLEVNKEYKDVDLGFKVFTLDTSNIQQWNVDSLNLEESLFAMENNFVEGRSHADIVYEVLLKLGLDLNTPFEESMVDGSTVYDVAFGNVYIVLGSTINQEVANHIADKQKEYENENPSVVFNDNGFVSDNEKLNSIEILKNNGFNEEQLMSI